MTGVLVAECRLFRKDRWRKWGGEVALNGFALAGVRVALEMGKRCLAGSSWVSTTGETRKSVAEMGICNRKPDKEEEVRWRLL